MRPIHFWTEFISCIGITFPNKIILCIALTFFSFSLLVQQDSVNDFENHFHLDNIVMFKILENHFQLTIDCLLVSF